MLQAVNNLAAALIEESEIRSALLRDLSLTAEPGSKIQEEFRIERGGSRIDVAVIGAGLVGFEIKSDKDSFARFANQIHAYNRVFDRITLVCGPKLAELAKSVIPSWWGLQVAARSSDGEVFLIKTRAPQDNPKQDPFSLASLLWKDEALAVLASVKASVSARASSHALWAHLAQTLPTDRIKGAVTQTLLRRQPYNELAVKTR